MDYGFVNKQLVSSLSRYCPTCMDYHNQTDSPSNMVLSQMHPPHILTWVSKTSILIQYCVFAHLLLTSRTVQWLNYRLDDHKTEAPTPSRVGNSSDLSEFRMALGPTQRSVQWTSGVFLAQRNYRVKLATCHHLQPRLKMGGLIGDLTHVPFVVMFLWFLIDERNIFPCTEC
jgi:hypothetical protein